ncbi:DMT family transporter [Janthinobacterium sp. J1-1]|uniref:DMT family transporter n=1 Tax=Janthinobacterium sp. J1-1 TaxID=3065910 RepID=UPI002811811C|nr:DMT family transporter [Janthinobacterium sp. J1-1]
MSTTSSPRSTALWQMLAAQFLIASVGIFVHEGGQDPVTTVFYRCLFGAIFLGLWGLTGGHLRGILQDRKLVLGAIASGVLLVLSWVSLFAGMARSSISVSTMMFYCYPFVMMVLATLLLGERTRPADWGWTLLAFLGLLCSAHPQRMLSSMGAHYQAGIGLSLLAGVLCGASLLLSRHISKQRAIAVVFLQCCVGALMLAAFSSSTVLRPGNHWYWLVGLGVIHSGLAYVLSYSAYRHLAVATIAVLSFGYPLLALLLDYLVYGQRLALVQLAGLGLIVLGSLGVSLKWAPARSGAERSVPQPPQHACMPGRDPRR